jgi:hypothetical protein
VQTPDVSYARSGEVAIAYQTFGSGPVDVVFARGFAGDLLSVWEQPLMTRFIEGLASKLAGIAVPVGARVADAAQPGEVLVSSTVKDLVAGSGLEFDDRGVHELKGVPGEWRLYAVGGA